MIPGMEQALATFVNESRELLEEMESSLIKIEEAEGEVNVELINAIFRSIHTIKGSAGIFGFDEVVKLTHVAETVLDDLRNSDNKLDNNLVSQLFTCCDLTSELIVLASNEIEPDETLLSQVVALIKQLRSYQRVSDTEDVAVCVQETDAKSSFVPQLWRISFKPKESVYQDGFDPLSFIRYLTKIGSIEQIDVDDSALVYDAEFDPEHCYLSYEISLRSNGTKREILDVFEFIQNDAEIAVFPVGRDESLSDDMVACSETQNIKTAAQIQQSKTLRIEAHKLDRLIDQVGEIVITGARTNLLAHKAGSEELIEAMGLLERLVENIRDSSLKLRMVQIGGTFNKFKRVVRDLAANVGKKVRLEVYGSETELDKTFVEKINDPLMHIVRNAIDHGIETPEERIKKGKSKTGKISLNSYHDSGSIVIEVRDDGKGIDKEQVRQKAISRGLVSETLHLTSKEVFSLIFEPGFSTAESVTNLSGRGVGMDVVRQNIDALRGTVEIDSEVEKGTQIIIRLPLTLSIIDGFMFEVYDVNYVIPLDMVVECMELHELVTEAQIKDKNFLSLRGEVLPFVRLRSLFGIAEVANHEKESLVVVQFGSLRAGLVVDSLRGEFQTVVKPLGRLFEGIKCISGATILGSGDVAVILDVSALIESAIAGYEKAEAEKG